MSNDTADSWTIFRAIREARSALGLSSGHVQTLQAMLSFLKPGKGQVVFASNIELCRRAGFIDERTLRRHIQRLAALGILIRQDSPNRKRYRVSAPDGDSESYGLSLSPLFKQAKRFLDLADAVETERRQCRFLRKKVLARLAVIEVTGEPTEATLAIRKNLRRKLGSDDYRVLLASLPDEQRAKDQHETTPSTAVDTKESQVLSANDGQNVRHHSKSKKERLDSDGASTKPNDHLAKVLDHCDEAQTYTQEPVKTWTDLTRHARFIAPMMGIDIATYERANQHLGEQRVSVTVFILMQLQRKIRNLPAYFHSITLGKRADSFDPIKVLDRLGAGQGVA
ncbi:plasmid replication protein RepC [Tropicibacter oceani]|uniref:Plasmid replication protein RepC n=1 Tax=Tropicibacter oceani TaxID=3058420 RepID=A0ABY8QQ73_9RHOB|nr:plasmid replication protein RepC [Tropicibacter oceani]WGW05967.1 plasmid replication protein RepC [Tropicibacter oceani]